jgi:hypothetical protein
LHEADVVLTTVKVQVCDGVVFKVTKTLPVAVIASEKLTIMSITAPVPYEPLAVADVILVIVGAVVSITIALLAVKFDVGVKLDTALPAVSVIVPAIKVVLSADAVSVAATI